MVYGGNAPIELRQTGTRRYLRELSVSPKATYAQHDGRALWSGRSLAEWLDELVAEIAALTNPLQVWVFGSVARGDDGPDSDIDLLVLLPHLSPSDGLALKQYVHGHVTVPVPFDVAFTDPDRFATRSKVPGTLERAALLDGRCVYG